jgi:WhiB family transcriptional regulator, redox-sensing transcriptional regulator
VGLSEENGMTTSNRNIRVSHRVAVSRTVMMDSARTTRHLAADTGIGTRHSSWWNNTWMALAKCRNMDPSRFFPSDAGGERAAQQICAVCPVKVPCLEYSLDNRMVDGVWGGRSEQERRFLLNQR